MAKYNYEDINNEFKQLEAFGKAMITVGDIVETLCRQQVSYNLDFWRDIKLFSEEYDDPSKLPLALNVTKYKKTFSRLVDQLDPQRQFVKFVYYLANDIWTVKSRCVPDQPFVNVFDIPSVYRLIQLFKRDDMTVTEFQILFVDKKGRFANATSEDIIKRIVSYAVEENNSGRKVTTNRKSRTTLNEMIHDKDKLKNIGKTALLATTMFGLGFLFAKNWTVY